MGYLPTSTASTKSSSLFPVNPCRCGSIHLADFPSRPGWKRTTTTVLFFCFLWVLLLDMVIDMFLIMLMYYGVVLIVLFLVYSSSCSSSCFFMLWCICCSCRYCCSYICSCSFCSWCFCWVNFVLVPGWCWSFGSTVSLLSLPHVKQQEWQNINISNGNKILFCVSKAKIEPKTQTTRPRNQKSRKQMTEAAKGRKTRPHQNQKRCKKSK